jgi:hypothetical protein
MHYTRCIQSIVDSVCTEVSSIITALYWYVLASDQEVEDIRSTCTDNDVPTGTFVLKAVP